jgi:hypothetical protein
MLSLAVAAIAVQRTIAAPLENAASVAYNVKDEKITCGTSGVCDSLKDLDTKTYHVFTEYDFFLKGCGATRLTWLADMVILPQPATLRLIIPTRRFFS